MSRVGGTPAVRRGIVGGLVAAVTLSAAGPAGAQVYLQDLVFTGGFSFETYNGTFPAVTVPVVDSTDHAGAAVGEFATAGSVRLFESFNGSQLLHSLGVQFDAGMRQHAATGFEQRDYAPREWVGRVDVSWLSRVGELGHLQLIATGQRRAVDDRPPMPLFLQPGYSAAQGTVVFQTRPLEDVELDVEADLESANYESTSLSQLDLLDRRSRGFEVGATTRRDALGESGLDSWRLRFFAGLRWHEYESQDSFDPIDPFRRDRTVHMGIDWQMTSTALDAALGVEGTLNRSNSQRPEYDAISFRGRLATPLPLWDLSMNLLGVLTGKSYVHDSPFARLVPGEEADNASQLYLDINKPLAANLTGALRFGWTRAETDIGQSYYSRTGVSVLLYYRPSTF